MMPLGAPSISKHGSLVRPNAQIGALRAHCARTALSVPPLSAMPYPSKNPCCHVSTDIPQMHGGRGVLVPLHVMAGVASAWTP